MKTTTKWLIALGLLLIPAALRFIWFNRGAYAPPELEQEVVIALPGGDRGLSEGEPAAGSVTVVFDLGHANNLAINDLAPFQERLADRGVEVVFDDGSGDPGAALRTGESRIQGLIRKYGRDAVLVGFTTHHGTVTAASDWDAPAERKNVRRALLGSYEALLHAVRVPRFMLALRGDERVAARLRESRLERAIGVIYRPQTERGSHYFHARLADQFDAVLHFDETRAVEPLETTAEWEAGEVPETYPFAV